MALPKPHRSAGPRTTAGRQAIAHNALRTGAYAAQVVLPGEDPAHFDELVQQFQHDFAPTDVAESALVHQLAVITWKMLRLDRIEHCHYLSHIHREYNRTELEPLIHLLPPADTFSLLLHRRTNAENALRLLQEKRLLTAINLGYVGRHHDDLDRAFQRTLAGLRRQQNWRRDRATLTVVPTPDSVSAQDTPAP